MLDTIDSARTLKELMLMPHSRQVIVVKMPNTTVTANSAAALCDALTMLDVGSVLSRSKSSRKIGTGGTRASEEGPKRDTNALGQV